MKKWRKTIGIAALCLLAIILVLPFCSATHKLVLKGSVIDGNWDEYEIGELHKGDEVKVVITKLHGDANNLVVELTRVNPYDTSVSLGWWDKYTFTSPGSFRFTVQEDGYYILVLDNTYPRKKETTVYYEGYVTY